MLIVITEVRGQRTEMYVYRVCLFVLNSTFIPTLSLKGHLAMLKIKNHLQENRSVL